MERPKINLLDILNDLSQGVYDINLLTEKLKNPGLRSSDRQTSIAQLKHLKRKFQDKKTTFKGMILGEVIFIKYTIDNHQDEAMLVNLSDEDIDLLFKTFAQWTRRSIQIQEIKRRKTYMSAWFGEPDI